ncbi:hypothetical protein IJU22_01420 [Candidatus Saccharibacteria bacterium]|nr:hypothetical protein [Candidatus Saccharibacteria bacterium]
MKTSYRVGIAPDGQPLDLGLEEIFRILESEDTDPFTLLDPFGLIAYTSDLPKSEKFRLYVDFLLHATSTGPQNYANLIHFNVSAIRCFSTFNSLFSRISLKFNLDDAEDKKYYDFLLSSGFTPSSLEVDTLAYNLSRIEVEAAPGLPSDTAFQIFASRLYKDAIATACERYLNTNNHNLNVRRKIAYNREVNAIDQDISDLGQIFASSGYAKSIDNDVAIFTSYKGHHIGIFSNWRDNFTERVLATVKNIK